MTFVALAGALALVLANGFFVAVEFSLVKVRTTQLEALRERGGPGVARVLEMRRRLDVWLSASQVGVTLASLGLGWVGEPAFTALLEPLILSLAPDVEWAQAAARTAGLVLAFGAISFLHIVVGEQVPKTIAIEHAERTALMLAWPMRAFSIAFFPVIWVLNVGTRAVLRALGLNAARGEAGEALGEEELKLVFTSAVRAGVLGAERAELLERALSMMEKTARQVMVSRSQMKAVDLEAPLDESCAFAISAGHTWLPVIRGSLDRVEGLVNVKELYLLKSKGLLKSIEQAQRPVFFVPEGASLEQLLAEFRRRNKQVAIVVDEHGGTSGIVTLADVVAELVGKVAELGRKVEPVRRLPGGKLELPGTTQLDDLEDTLEVTFDVDKAQVTTVAGYLMAKLGRVPVSGDVWTLEELRLVVVRTDGPRVVSVRIEPAAPVVSPAPAP